MLLAGAASWRLFCACAGQYSCRERMLLLLLLAAAAAVTLLLL